MASVVSDLWNIFLALLLICLIISVINAILNQIIKGITIISIRQQWKEIEKQVKELKEKK